jgi:arginine decarboxylase
LIRWSVGDSAELYGLNLWGRDFFSVSPDGQVTVSLPGPGDTRLEIGLFDVAKGLEERGIPLPVLLRFPDVLSEEITQLNETFLTAMAESGYEGTYRGVFPIKVNQQQQIIEEIVRGGAPFHHGLEAGSKAELFIALGMLDDPEALIVCNGYKDREFIDLALLGSQAGSRVILVVERPGEVDLILERSAALGIEPVVGIRAKLSSSGGGNWAESGGDHSIFGLTASQMVDAVDSLRAAGKLECLKLLHSHLGSQIPDIRAIRQGVREAARYYVSLVAEGAAMSYLDVGGGLAIDYDGSQTNFSSSRNYTVNEYCSDVVDGVQTACEEAEIPVPTIVSESGRAVSAYSSVLLFNILDVNRLDSTVGDIDLAEGSPPALENLAALAKGDGITLKNLQEAYHDALYYRDEIRGQFLLGELDLRARAVGDRCFWRTLTNISRLLPGLKRIPEELQDLDEHLADVYYGNMSIFQSLPDNWAIEQLFPVMPIHRLDERPGSPGVVADTTCDSDGKIDRFIDVHDVKKSLLLHELRGAEPYVLGAFLVGAYQETLGDLHNLFGDTHAVSIVVDEEGELDYQREVTGDSVADVLSYVEYDPRALANAFRDRLERAVRRGMIPAGQRRTILRAYEEGLQGYTYCEGDE